MSLSTAHHIRTDQSEIWFKAMVCRMLEQRELARVNQEKFRKEYRAQEKEPYTVHPLVPSNDMISFYLKEEQEKRNHERVTTSGINERAL